jgi:pimeloyl-ACP methyl ester carboxylesterase
LIGPRDATVDLPQLRLAARVWGAPTLPRLLALHGWLDNAASFDRLAPLLCEHFHIVALDLPGHGRSDHRPPGVWYHYVDYLGDVLQAADALGWERFGLLGHSLGGAVASVLAAACPQRVERLLLIEALGPLSAGPEQALAQLQRALSQRGDLADKALRVFASVDEAAQARAQASDLSLDVARVLVGRGIKPVERGSVERGTVAGGSVEGGFVWSSDPRLTLASPQRYTEAQIQTILAGIRVPTRLVLAEPAPVFLPEDLIRARIAQVPGIEVVRLPGHHHLHLEDPAPVAAALLAM